MVDGVPHRSPQDVAQYYRNKISGIYATTAPDLPIFI
jgi:hypothetical protein